MLWLNRMYCAREIAEQIQDHARRYLAEAGALELPRHAALRFDEISQHPELLQRLLAEPEFAHLRAIVATLPGCQAPDGNRPGAQIMYVRDLTALRSIQIDYGALPVSRCSECRPPRRWLPPRPCSILCGNPCPSPTWWSRPWPVG